MITVLIRAHWLQYRSSSIVSLILQTILMCSEKKYEQIIKRSTKIIQCKISSPLEFIYGPSYFHTIHFLDVSEFTTMYTAEFIISVIVNYLLKALSHQTRSHYVLPNELRIGCPPEKFEHVQSSGYPIPPMKFVARPWSSHTVWASSDEHSVI